MTVLAGNVVAVRVEFVITETGADTNPTTVTFTFTDPTGTETEYVYGVDAELIRDSTGHYHVEIPASIVGVYNYDWEATGSGASTGTGRFRVKAL